MEIDRQWTLDGKINALSTVEMSTNLELDEQYHSKRTINTAFGVFAFWALFFF